MRLRLRIALIGAALVSHSCKSLETVEESEQKEIVTAAVLSYAISGGVLSVESMAVAGLFYVAATSQGHVYATRQTNLKSMLTGSLANLKLQHQWTAAQSKVANAVLISASTAEDVRETLKKITDATFDAYAAEKFRGDPSKGCYKVEYWDSASGAESFFYRGPAIYSVVQSGDFGLSLTVASNMCIAAKALAGGIVSTMAGTPLDSTYASCYGGVYRPAEGPCTPNAKLQLPNHSSPFVLSFPLF